MTEMTLGFILLWSLIWGLALWPEYRAAAKRRKR